MIHLPNDHDDCSNQHKNSQAIQWTGAFPLWIWCKVNGNCDNKMIRISQWRESHYRINTSIRRNEFKRVGLSKSQSWIQVGKLVIWVRLLQIITEFTKSIISTRIARPVLMMDIKVLKDKHINRWVDWENFIYVRWNKI